MTLSEVHEKVLSFITFVGGALSIIGCLTSIIIYRAFRSPNIKIQLQKKLIPINFICYRLSSERIRIHQMFALSIILSQTVFFAGFQRTKIQVFTKYPPSVMYNVWRHYFWVVVGTLQSDVNSASLFADVTLLLDARRRDPLVRFPRQSVPKMQPLPEVPVHWMG